ncbi:MAG: PspC domain-containing protein [Bacteroidetes bacterium]|nr:PspC domain-containing protein [Bacteroidota bacterium]
MNNQRLYRSQSNKVFAGVCGGIAEYFDVDPVVIRIIWVLLIVFGGTGILLYIACIFIIPKKPYQTIETPTASETAGNQRSAPQSPGGFRSLLGYVLVAVGIFFLLENFNLFSLSDFFESVFQYIIPIVLIIAGMAIIYYRQTTPEISHASSETTDTGKTEAPPRYRELRRSRLDRKLFGVCGGLAEYFTMDSSIVRILYIILCFVSFGAGIILYLLLALFVPDDSIASSKS